MELPESGVTVLQQLGRTVPEQHRPLMSLGYQESPLCC